MNSEPNAQDTHAIPGRPSSTRTSAEPGAGILPPGTIPAQLLFQGSREIQISHNGEHYRLRITRNGKLILTK